MVQNVVAVDDEFLIATVCNIIVVAHDGDVGHRIYSIPVPSLKFVGFPFGRCGAFSASALIGLETLTFDLSTSKWSHGSPVSWASLLSIFSLLCPSILDSGSGTEQTERHGHQRFMPRDPMGAGIINDG